MVLAQQVNKRKIKVSILSLDKPVRVKLTNKNIKSFSLEYQRRLQFLANGALLGMLDKKRAYTISLSFEVKRDIPFELNKEYYLFAKLDKLQMTFNASISKISYTDTPSQRIHIDSTWEARDEDLNNLDRLIIKHEIRKLK